MIFAGKKNGRRFLQKLAGSIFLAGALCATGTLVADDKKFPAFSTLPRSDIQTKLTLAQTALRDGIVSLAMDFSAEILNAGAQASPAQLNTAALIMASAQIERGKFAEAEKMLQTISSDSAAKMLRLTWAKIGQSAFWEAAKMLKQINTNDLSSGDLAWYELASGILAKQSGDDAVAQTFFKNAVSKGINAAQRAQFEYIRIWAETTFKPELSEFEIKTLREDAIRAKGTRKGALLSKLLALTIYRKARSGDAETHKQAREALAIAKPIPPDMIPEFNLLEGVLQESPATEEARRAFVRVLSDKADRSLQEAALAGLVRHVTELIASGKSEAATTAANEIVTFLNSEKLKLLPELADLGIFTRAQLSQLSKDAVRLERAVKELLEKFPSSSLCPEALRLVIAEKIEAHEYRSAVRYLEKLRNLAGSALEKSTVSLVLADSYFQNGDYRLAADAYSKIEFSGGLEELSGAVFSQRILSELCSGEFEKAQALINAQKVEMQQKNAPFNRNWIFRAECMLIDKLREDGQTESARLQCEKFLEQPNVPDAYRIRVLWWNTLLAIELNLPEIANESADKIIALLEAYPNGIDSIPQDAETLKSNAAFLKARALLRGDDLDAARKELANLRKNFKESDAAVISYLDEGHALVEKDRLFEALSCFDKLIERCGNNPKFTDYAVIAYFEAAQQEAALGRPQNAAERLKNLVKQFPDSSLVFYARSRQADLLRAQNDFDAALLIYDSLIASVPAHPDLYRVEIARADCLFANASSIRPNTKPDSLASRQNSLRLAISAYERLFSLPDAPIELRAEAGYKWGEASAKRASLAESPTDLLRESVNRDARKIYWRVVEEIFNQASKGGVDPSENWGVSTGYWLARSFFAVGHLSEEVGDYDDARKAYEKVKNWSARGWMPGSEYARSREEAIRDK